MKTNMSVCSLNEMSAFKRCVNVSRNAIRSSYIVLSRKADVLRVLCVIITFCCKGDIMHDNNLLLQGQCNV